ncbi:MAG: hypothetical protein M9938_00595 [Solirubrobacterales bacterium]|nr:hypothetical protein [Solirubrobacterales bacterium]
MRKKLAGLFALLLGAALAAGLLVSPVSANASPRNGAYSQNVGTEFASINVENGRIKMALSRLKFRIGGRGRSCVPAGTFPDGSHVIIRAVPRPRIWPDRRGRFSFRLNALGAPRVNVKVAGRFVNDNRASFRVNVWQGRCKASVTAGNARYSRL